MSNYCGNMLLLLITILLLIQVSQTQDLVAGVSISDNQNQINQQATYRFTIIPSELSFDAGTVIQTYLPTSISLILSSSNTITVCRRYIKLTNTVVGLNNCVYNSTQQMVQFSITQVTTFDVAYEYEVAYILNPGISEIVTGFRIVINDQYGNTLYDTSQLSAAVQIYPGSITNQTLTDSSQKVSDTGTYTFSFQISNKIPGDGLFQITFPQNEINVPTGITNSNTRVKIYDQTWQTGNILISSMTITFQNSLNGTPLTPITGKYILIEIQNVVNPKSLKQTSSFAITSMDNQYNQIDQATTLLTVQPTIPGDITIFSVGPYTSSAVGQTTDLNFNIQIPQAYDTGGYLLITFPVEVALQSLTCYPYIGFVTQNSNCALTQNSPQTVKVSNSVSSTRLYILISSAQNPNSTRTTSTFTIQAYDPSNYLMSQILSGVNYTSTPAALKAGTSVRSITQVALISLNNLTISLTLNNALYAGDYIMVKVPYEQMQIVSPSFLCQITALGSTSIPSFTLDTTSNSSYFIVTLVSPCNSGCSQGQSMNLVLNGVKNPPYIQPSYSKSIEIYTMTADQFYLRDKKVTSIYTTPLLTEGPIQNMSIIRSFYQVNNYTQIQISFNNTTPIPSNGQIRFYLPASSFYNPASGQISCLDLSGASILTCSSILNSDSPPSINYIQIQGECANGCIANQGFNLSLLYLKNKPSIKPIINSFGVRTLTTEGYYIDYGNTSLAQGLNLLPASFNSLQITYPTQNIITGSQSSLTLKINSTNGIAQSYGQLIITLPLEISLTSNSQTCQASTSTATLNCQVLFNLNQINITNPNSNSYAGQFITLSIVNGIYLPITTQPSSFFLFQTSLYDTQNSTFFLVEQDLNSLQITANTPNSLKYLSVTRQTIQINAQTNMIINFTTTNPIPKNSLIIIGIPKDQAIFITGQDPILQDYSSGFQLQAQTISNLQSSSGYLYIYIQEWCSQNGNLNQCPKNTSLSLLIQNGYNPTSTKLPSMSFTIQIQQDNQYYSDQTLNNLFIQPLLTAGKFKSITFSETSNTIGALVNQTITFQINNGIPSGLNGYLEISLPNYLYYVDAIQNISCYSGTHNLDCNFTQGSSLFGNYYQAFTLNMNCQVESCTQNTIRSLTITNLRNRYTRDFYSGTIQVQTSDQDDLTYDASQIDISQTLLSQQLSYSSLAVIKSLTRTNLTVSQPTDLQIAFKNFIPFVKNSIIQIQLPSEYFQSINIANQKLVCKTSNAISVDCFINQTLSNSSLYVVQFIEFCSQNNNQICPSNTTQQIQISNFINRQNTQQISTPIGLDILSSEFLLYELNQNQIQFSTTLQPALAIIYQNITSSNQKVGEFTVLDIYFRLQNVMNIGDLLNMTMSQAIYGFDNSSCILMATQSGLNESLGQTCTILTDSASFVSKIDYLTQQTLNSNIGLVVRLKNVQNIGEVKAQNLILNIQATSIDGYFISSGSSSYQVNLLQPNQFQSIQVTRSINDLATDTQITILYQTAINILANSNLLISIPKSQFISLNSTSITCLFEQTQKQITNVLTDINFTNFTVKNICESTTCIANQNYSVQILGLSNPTQVLAISNSIFLQIQYTDQNQIIAQNSFDVQAQPPLKLGQLQNLSIIQNSTLIVGDLTNYFISFKIPSSLTISDQLYIQVPSQTITNPTSGQIQCQNLNKKQTLTCQTQLDSDNFITLIMLKTYCSQSDCSQNTLQIVQLSNIFNVYFVRQRTTNLFTVMAVTSSGFVMSQNYLAESTLPAFQVRQIQDLMAIRDSTQAGDTNVGLTISFTTKMIIPQGSILTYYLPIDQQQFSDPFSLICVSGSITLSCIIIQSNNSYIVANLSEWCTSDCQTGTLISLKIMRTINPSQIQTSFSSSFGLKISNKNGQMMQQSISGIIIQPQIDSINFTGIMVSRQINIVGTSDYLKFVIPMNQYIATDTDVTIRLPNNSAFYPVINQICSVYISGWNDNFQCIYQKANISSLYWAYQLQLVKILSVCSSTYPCKIGQSLIIRFSVQNPYSQLDPLSLSAAFNLTFTQSSLEIGYGQTTNILTQLIQNNLTANIINQSSCFITGQICNLQLLINTANPIASNQNSSSFLQIQLPKQDSLQSNSSCQAFLFKTVISCIIINTTYIQIKHSYDTKNQIQFYYNVTIANLKAPFSTEPSDSFQIQTYQQINSTYYQVDTLRNNLSLTVNQPNQFNQVKIIRSTAVLGQYTSLLLILTLKNPIPQNGQIALSIPASQLNQDSLISCNTSYLQSTLSKVTCQYDQSTRVFTLNNLCNKNGGCLGGDQLVFTLESSELKNPSYSLDVYDNLIDSVNITSFYISNNDNKTYLIDQTYQGVFITPVLSTQQIVISNFSSTSNYTSDYITLEFTAQLSNYSLYFTQEYLQLVFYDFSYNKDDFTDLIITINGLSSKILLIDKIDQNDTLKSITFSCDDNSCKNQNSLDIQISNMKNPYFKFQNLQQYQSGQNMILMYEVVQIPNQIISSGSFDLQNSLKSLALTQLRNAQIYQSNFNFSSYTNAQIIFTLYNRPRLDDQATITIYMGTSYQFRNNILQCTDLQSMTMLNCTYQSQSNLLTINNYFSNQSEFISQTTVALNISGIINPNNQASQILQIQINNNNRIYAYDTTSFKLQTILTSTNCTKGCSLCTAKDNTCLRCIQPSISPLLQQGQCVSQCSNGYFEQNQICYQCTDQCASCQQFDSCTICEQTNQKLLDGICMNQTINSPNQCPNSTLQNNQGVCVQQDCTNSNTYDTQIECQLCGVTGEYCYFCKNGLFSLNGICVSNCPLGYYSNQYNQCLKCNSSCLSCEDSPNKCTSCRKDIYSNSKLDLSTNQCVSQCSGSSVSNDQNPDICEKCDSQCYSCSITTRNCTSCYYNKDSLADLFYYNNQCLETCPIGYFANYETHNCDEQNYQILSFPPIYLVSSVALGGVTLVASKFLSGRADLTSEIGLSIVTQIEFFNRIFLFLNLWSSTKTLSFCVTCLALVGNSFLAIYFVTLVIQPICNQLPQLADNQSSSIFKAIIILSQITGINTLRLLTSKFLGISLFDCKFTELVYYVKQLEAISLLSTALNLFQLCTGISCIIDFGFSQDAMGLGVNSIILNAALIGVQLFKYIKALKLINQYEKVNQM